MAIPDESAAKIQCSTPEGLCREWRVDSPARLEIFLRSQMPDASRESLRRALAAGECEVDGRVRCWGYRVAAGALVRLGDGVRITEVPAETIPLEVLYEDSELIAIDKPAGMLAHPTSQERRGTVMNALRGMGLGDARILHRLDRGTSGVLLAAKTTAGAARGQMFELRQVRKAYLAVVDGELGWKEQVCRFPIGRVQGRQPAWNVTEGGAAAETRLRVLGQREGQTLIEAEPVTGRTNQIRIHLAAAGHPIAGDAAYGGAPWDRMLLHAWRLTISTGTGQRTITAPPPAVIGDFTREL
jgi:23S rRNA pseudouridine1911/1915/1917 synthase